MLYLCYSQINYSTRAMSRRLQWSNQTPINSLCAVSTDASRFLMIKIMFLDFGEFYCISVGLCLRGKVPFHWPTYFRMLCILSIRLWLIFNFHPVAFQELSPGVNYGCIWLSYMLIKKSNQKMITESVDCIS